MRTTPAAIGETILVVLVGLLLGAAVAALPFVVSVPPAMQSAEFMRVWMVLAPVITMTIMWFRLRRVRPPRRRPDAPGLRLGDE